MNPLLYLRIYMNHPGIEIRMIPHQYFWIPCRCHENCIHSASQWCHEDLAYLQSNKEAESHDDWGKGAAFVIGRVSELQVEECEESGEVGDKGRAHGQDGADKAVVDECVNASVLHHAGIHCQIFGSFASGRGMQTYVQVSLAAGM